MRQEAKINDFQDQTEKYEQLLNEAGDEIDRLNTIIKDKNKYLEAWQERYREAEAKQTATEEQLSLLLHHKQQAQEEITKLSHGLRHKSEQMEKMERTREQEQKTLKEKLAEVEAARIQISSARKEREQEKEEQKRRQTELLQLKDQLSKRVTDGNRLFEDLNRVEGELKDTRKKLLTAESNIKHY